MSMTSSLSKMCDLLASICIAFMLLSSFITNCYGILFFHNFPLTFSISFSTTIFLFLYFSSAHFQFSLIIAGFHLLLTIKGRRPYAPVYYIISGLASASVGKFQNKSFFVFS